MMFSMGDAQKHSPGSTPPRRTTGTSDNRHAGHEAFNVSFAQNHLLDVTVRGSCPACRFDERNREDHGRFGGDIPLFDFD